MLDDDSIFSNITPERRKELADAIVKAYYARVHENWLPPLKHPGQIDAFSVSRPLGPIPQEDPTVGRFQALTYGVEIRPFLARMRSRVSYRMRWIWRPR